MIVQTLRAGLKSSTVQLHLLSVSKAESLLLWIRELQRETI